MKHEPRIDGRIKCQICKGTKKHQTAHPSHNAPCGACFGTGFSTNPIDQPRNLTMIGRDAGETTEERTGHLPSVQVHSPGTCHTLSNGRPRFTGILISWANTEYDARLALDQQGLLYPTTPP